MSFVQLITSTINNRYIFLIQDPAFPKSLYPSVQQCPKCYVNPKAFDEVKVEEYLLKIYSHPERHTTALK